MKWGIFLWAILAARGRGELVVHSATVGAEVFVDGQPVGAVPLAAPLELSAGQHTVKITKRGFTDFLGTVEAVAGETRELRAELRELPVTENPFRPAPPPARWYEHWYVWASGAALVVAVTAALVIPAAFGGGPSSCQDFPGSFCYDLRRH